MRRDQDATSHKRKARDSLHHRTPLKLNDQSSPNHHPIPDLSIHSLILIHFPAITLLIILMVFAAQRRLELPQIGEPLMKKSSRETRKENTSISLRRSGQNWLSGNLSRNTPSLKLPPVSYSNQILAAFKFLKRLSSSARFCYQPICSTVQIRSHIGYERLHPPAHQRWRRTLRNELARRRVRRRMRARLEIADIKKEDLGEIRLAPTESNMNILKGSIPGPQGSIYEGGIFEVEIVLPADYPYVASLPSYRCPHTSF